MRDQNEVDFFRRIACAVEVARQVPERSSTKPGTRARIDEDQLLAGVDREACIGGLQQVRIFVQCIYNTIQRPFISGQPVQIGYGGAIE